jgi:hypothetical protein
MRFTSANLGFGALGAASAALFLSFQVQLSAMPASDTSNPASINRASKTDRLPVPAAVQTLEHPTLPQGCVAKWDRGSIYTAEIAGRCIG